jgi:hypothetical protein
MSGNLFPRGGPGTRPARIALPGVWDLLRASLSAALPHRPRLSAALHRRGPTRSKAAVSGIGAMLLAAAVIALPLEGCGAQAPAGSTPAVSTPFAAASTGQPFLDLIPDAPLNTTYAGTRHVTFSYRVNDVPVTLDYTERVISDGQGQFTVIPLDVAEPAMSAQAQEVFDLLQMHREGFLYRHRDFRIRDLALFQQNYSVSDLGPPVTVCGRSCAWLEMRRQSGGQSYYHVAVDVQNGLILRYEEYSNAGQLQARVEFTDLTLTPDLRGVQFHVEQMLPQALDLNSDTTPQIGFVVHAPTLLPSNYQLEKAEKIDDGTQSWARLSYGDGAEQIFFLYSVDPDASNSPPSSATAGGHGHTPKRLVHVFHFGPWIVAQGDLDTRRMIAVGKTDEAALLQMLQSALH